MKSQVMGKNAFFYRGAKAWNVVLAEPKQKSKEWSLKVDSNHKRHYKKLGMSKRERSECFSFLVIDKMNKALAKRFDFSLDFSLDI